MKRKVHDNGGKSILFIITASCTFSFLVLGTYVNQLARPVEPQFIIGTLVKSTTHLPISLENNSALDAFPDKTGNGTTIDPYIISNLTIDGSASGVCFDLYEIDRHLIVQNCTFVNSSISAAILYYCSNITIRNCSIYNNTIGIYLAESSDLSFTKNNFNNDNHAILVDSGENITIHDNTFLTTGIDLGGSAMQLSTFNITTENTIDGKKIYFFTNRTGLQRSDFINAGEILLSNCNDSHISGLNLSGQYQAMNIFHSRNITIAHCIFDSNSIGLNILSSTDNTVTSCNFTSNGIGILMQYTDKHQIHWNNFLNAQDFAVQIYALPSHLNNWSKDGKGNYWSDYTTKYPLANQSGLIWDTPYLIESSNVEQDTCPLVNMQALNFNPPILLSGNVTPKVGDMFTPLNFSVVYSDSENGTPSFMDVTVNGTNHAMQKVDAFDVNYVDGCVYARSLMLTPGDYVYTFSCSDGLYEVVTNVFEDLVIDEVNLHSPVLWNGSVLPGSGYNQSTTFSFHVYYSDEDNNVPNYMRVIINGTTYDMDKVNPADMNYTDGCEFTFSGSLDPGVYRYTFNVSDGGGDTGIGPFMGPNVEIIRPWANYSIGNLHVGVVISHGENNPIPKYPAIISSLLGRGVSLNLITTMITGDILSRFDVLWFDCGGTSVYNSEIDVIEEWIRTGGRLLITGDIFTVSTLILRRFGINTTFQPSVGTTTSVNLHHLSYGVSTVNLPFPRSYLVLNASSNATSVVRMSGRDYVIASTPGLGRLAVLSDDDLLSQPGLGNNGILVQNTFGWLGEFQHGAENDPTLTLSSVSPVMGNQSVPFAFQVTYTDLDNNTPHYTNVCIDGEEHALEKVDPSDFCYSDGCAFNLTLYLQPGTFEFYFACENMFGAAQTTNQTLVVSAANAHLPQLLGGSISPVPGYNGTTIFTFEVTYIDADNNEPTSIVVILNGSVFPMLKMNTSDTNYIDGCKYRFSTALGVGVYSVLFNASDGAFLSSTSIPDFEVFLFTPLFFDGFFYNWTGIFNHTIGNPFVGTETFSDEGNGLFDITSTDPTLTFGLRTINGTYGFIEDDHGNYFIAGSHEWTRIFFTSLRPGRHVLIGVPLMGDQDFTVSSTATIPAMGQFFDCWVLVSPEGSIAYYDKSTGLLVNGTFWFTNSIDDYEYSIQLTGTNLELAEFNPVPSLLFGNVTPGTGNQSTLFNFTVIFSDAQNDAPAFVEVIINGSAHVMIKADGGDANYTDGCLYQYITYLQPENYTYLFRGSDGAFINETSSYSGLIVNKTNEYTPSLSYPKIEPAIGTTATTFVFSITYSDPDNNMPTEIDIIIDGMSFSMMKENASDANYIDGCRFTYSTKLSQGKHIFKIEASDGENTIEMNLQSIEVEGRQTENNNITMILLVVIIPSSIAIIIIFVKEIRAWKERKDHYKRRL